MKELNVLQILHLIFAALRPLDELHDEMLSTCWSSSQTIFPGFGMNIK